MLFSQTLSVLAVASLSQLALALPEPHPQITPAPAFTLIKPTCFYTYTETVPYTKRIPTCPLIKCVAPKECTETKVRTTTKGCKNVRCPITPTVTVTGKPACPTCNTGCFTTTTSTATVTQTTRCVIYTNPVEPPVEEVEALAPSWI